MGDVFRLNELSGEPLWMLDAGRSEPRICLCGDVSN